MLSFFRKSITPPPDFQIPPDTRIYAVGDIHGQTELLEKTLQAIEQDAKNFTGDRIIQIFLGDYIDRGIHSREVIDLLTQTPPKGHERICLLGNHEATLLEFIRTPETIRKWSNFGGFTTLASYGLAIPKTLSSENVEQLHYDFMQVFPKEHQDFLEKLYPSYTVGDYFFVHAGINPYLPFEEQSSEDLIWIRDDFTDFEDYHSKYIIHGHTPVNTLDIRRNRANLDLSETFGEQLGCLKLESNQRINFTINRHND